MFREWMVNLIQSAADFNQDTVQFASKDCHILAEPCCNGDSDVRLIWVAVEHIKKCDDLKVSAVSPHD